MKKKISIILTIFFLFAFSINVYAKGKSDIEIDKAEIKRGEEVTITIKLGEEKEIYAYTAKLSYDKEVFEQIKEEDFEEQENWSDITYNANNNKFGLINKSGEAEDENMLKIKLKAKNDAKAGKTEIEINNIEASDGQQDIAIEGSTVEVEIEDAAQNQGTAGNIANNNKQEEKAPIQVKKKTPILAISLIIIMTKSYLTLTL